MKKLVYILLMFIIAFSACDPNENIYDDLDKLVPEYEGTVESFIFTADDYATASSYAKKDAVGIGDADSTYAKLIKSMEAFNNYYPAEDYVGSVLAEYFPEYGKNSRAYVTYNSIATIPEESGLYTNADVYSFVAADYEMIDSLVSYAGYFYPEFNPDLYLQKYLPSIITGANDGDIYLVNYLYSDVTPLFPEVATIYWFEEEFVDTLGQFDTTNVIGSKSWYSSGYGDDTFAKMSGYGQDNEDWLISDDIVIGNEDNVTLNFTHAIKYLNDQWDQISVLISEDYDGSDIEGAEWTAIDWGLVADTASLGSDYTFYPSGDIDISSYAGKTINVAFKYTSTTANAATWEILDVAVVTGAKIIGPAPSLYKDFYKLSGTSWSKVEGVHCLGSNDYDAMGDPGDDGSFSNDILPQNYLPKFLDALYPEAGEGVSKIVVYQYDTDIEDEITLATKYIYKDGEWESMYDYIEEATNQFVHNGEKWLFDPTIVVEMSSSNYQLIVDYVKTNISADYIDKYGTAESYYGAGAYYKNFSISDGYWEADVFDSWEKAVEEAIGTILLPELFPDAQLQANGVDMFYRVIFETFKSGVKVNYAMNFQVTKAGPDPEFTLDEDGAVEQ